MRPISPRRVPSRSYYRAWSASSSRHAPRRPTSRPKAAEMKPYTEAIPGTDLKFDLVPIPAGTFTMGSPAAEAEAQGRRGAATRGRDRAVLDGQVRGDLGRVRPVRLLDGHQEEEARERRPRQPARDREGVRRRHPADPALRRRDLRVRPQGAAGHLRHPPLGDGILPLALGQDGQDLPAARPRPSGNTPAGPGPRRPTRSATTRRSSATTPGTSRTPRSPSRSARRSRTRGACTTSTATSRSGAWTRTSRTFTVRSPKGP